MEKEIDCDLLISVVQMFPTLWDKKNDEYKNRVAIDKCWMEVAAMVYDEWHTMDTRTKNDTLAEMKRKWRHLRDCFVRWLNQGKSGDAAPKRKKYIYADSLDFLRNSLEKRDTSGNFECTDPDEAGEGQHEPDKDTPEESQNTTRPSPTSSSPGPSAQRSKQKNELTPFQTQLLNSLQPSTPDPHTAYLLSLAPFYTKLNDAEKLEFQQHVLTFMVAKNRSHSTLIQNPSSFNYVSPPASYMASCNNPPANTLHPSSRPHHLQYPYSEIPQGFYHPYYPNANTQHHQNHFPLSHSEPSHYQSPPPSHPHTGQSGHENQSSQINHVNDMDPPDQNIHPM